MRTNSQRLPVRAINLGGDGHAHLKFCVSQACAQAPAFCSASAIERRNASLVSVAPETPWTCALWTPATDDELAFSLAFALCHDGKRAFRHAEQFMAKITAAHLIEHLKRSGYVVMKRPPARDHSMAARPGRQPE